MEQSRDKLKLQLDTQDGSNLTKDVTNFTQDGPNLTQDGSNLTDDPIGLRGPNWPLKGLPVASVAPRASGPPVVSDFCFDHCFIRIRAPRAPYCPTQFTF